jgi:hypothetical protein
MSGLEDHAVAVVTEREGAHVSAEVRAALLLEGIEILDAAGLRLVLVSGGQTVRLEEKSPRRRWHTIRRRRHV